jgi:hypothetical protein
MWPQMLKVVHEDRRSGATDSTRSPGAPDLKTRRLGFCSRARDTKENDPGNASTSSELYLLKERQALIKISEVSQ